MITIAGKPAARLGAILWTILGSMLIGTGLQQGPKKSEQSKLVEQFYKLDRRSEPVPKEEAILLARLAETPDLKAKDVKKWRKALLKAWGKGPKLEKKGTNYLFDDKQGKYIVGGKLSRPKGLAICMHGGGVGSGDAGSASGAYQSSISDMGWVGIFPEVLKKTEHGWTDSGSEEFVLELVDRALRTWDINPDNVYFVGHSMGGYGSWMLGARHADRVAAIAPSAGAPSPIFNRDGTVWRITDGVIPNLRSVPMVIYQSTDDVQVPPAANQAAVKDLKEAQERWGGYDFEYWEETDRGHRAPPGGHQAHLEKIAGYTRDELPLKIVWQPEITWKRQFYWLWWDELTPRKIIEAEADWEKREVRIKTDADTKNLSVLLSSELVDLDKEFVIYVNDTETWRGTPKRRLEVLLATSRHGDPRLTFEAKIPVGVPQ
jgi:predicted esterase